MSVRAPERLNLPIKFPAAVTIPEVPEVYGQQQNWWSDVKQRLQDAIEALRFGKNRFEVVATASSFPFTVTNGQMSISTNYANPVWVEVIAPDGSPCVMPIWKKV